MNKKILLLISAIVLITCKCTWAGLGRVTDSHSTLESTNDLQQLYHQNKYIIDQLEVLARAKGKRPHRIGAQLSKADIALLIIKQSSLNYLIQVEYQRGIQFQPFKKNYKFDQFDQQALLLQSRILLSNLPDLFARNQMDRPVAFNESSISSWYEPTVTTEKIYSQQLRIESLLHGLKNVIKPKSVYEVALSTRELISGSCKSISNVTVPPLIMGKRPKDVYKLFYKYLAALSKKKNILIPEKGPIHIYPHDVFDIAIIAMTYSLQIVVENDDGFHSDIDSFKHQKKIDNITPSHVYQAVAHNINVLECSSHAS